MSEDNHSLLSNESLVPAKAVTKHRFVRSPMIIAAIILICSVVGLTIWGVFFNNTIENTVWLLSYQTEGKECSIGFQMEQGKSCRFYNGGVMYKGSYEALSSLNNKEMLQMNYTMYGEPAMKMSYYYRLDGNSLSGRKLILTDLNEKSILDSAETSSQKIVADTVEENGKTYYVYTLSPAEEYPVPYTALEHAKTDSKLLGIWLYKSDDGNTDNTFAFYDNGTYELTYRDCVFKGCYSAENGEIDFNFTLGNGIVNTKAISYSFDEDILILNNDVIPTRYEKTDRVDAFDNGMK